MFDLTTRTRFRVALMTAELLGRRPPRVRPTALEIPRLSLSGCCCAGRTGARPR